MLLFLPYRLRCVKNSQNIIAAKSSHLFRGIASAPPSKNINFLNYYSYLIRVIAKGHQPDGCRTQGRHFVYNKKVHLDKWSDNAVGYMWCDSNDFQKASTMTALFSSVWGQGHGFYVSYENLGQAAVVYTVRRVIKPTWLNDRDQFLQPTKPLSEEFKSDCLIWMLFNGSNLTASANDLEWNGKQWSIVNHFIPYTEAEVNAPDRFESDFMVQYLADKIISTEAQNILDEGKKLWQAYFAHTDVRTVRDELKLIRADVGWYQIRKALQARNSIGDFPPVSFTPFEKAYKALTEKLQPMVYELGFLELWRIG